MNRKSLFLLGMHRSGTSLAANWLYNCGLNLGHQLIGATFSNIKGHYEDIDFVEYHEKLLRLNKNTLYAKLNEPMMTTEYFEARAKSLVYLRYLLAEQWGVKQPRGTLFLPLWRKVNPDFHYFIPYRSYEQVVFSLWNREFKKVAIRNEGQTDKIHRLQAEKLANKAQICNDFLSMWIRHNQEVITHLSLVDREKVLLLEVSDLTNHDKAIYDIMTKKWGFELDYAPISDIYEPKLMHREKIENFSPELEQLAKETSVKLEGLRQVF